MEQVIPSMVLSVLITSQAVTLSGVTISTRSCVQSNLTFETDKDKGVDKLGGKVTLTVDRSRVDTFMVKDYQWYCYQDLHSAI